MGAFLDKPKTDKTNNEGESNGLKYASSAMQGWRMEMEDSDVCMTDLKIKGDERLEGWSFFGVFDGHAGAKVSKKCSESIWDSIKKHISKQNPSLDEVKQALEMGFIDFDQQIRDSTPWASGEDHSGSTAIAVLISPTHIFWANCGDSRGIFCSGEKLEFSTTDHKPMNEVEKNRIEAAGGTVMMQRVNGTLAVSRALGDFDYKRDMSRKPTQQLVSPQPDINVSVRDGEKDKFVLLACDGIFDVLTNEEVVAFILEKLSLMNGVDACNHLIDTCLLKNSRDNMSVVLILFPGAPKISNEKLAKNEEKKKQLQAKIVEFLKSVVENAGDALECEENHVFHTISTDDTIKDNYGLLIYENKDFVFDQLRLLTSKKFGSQQGGDFTGPSDSSVAPPELQLGLQGDDGYHGFDPNLIEMENDLDDNMDTSSPGGGEETVTDGNESSSVDTT